MKLRVFKKFGVLASVEVNSTFLDKSKSKQFEDAMFNKIRNKVFYGEDKDIVVDHFCVLR